MDHFKNAYPIVFLFALSDITFFSHYRSPFFQYDDKSIKMSQQCQFFFIISHF